MYLQQPFALVLLENTAREILFQISYVKTPSINKAWQSEGYPFQLFFFFLKYIYFVLAWKHSREILSKNKDERVLFRPHFSPGNFIPHLPNSLRITKHNPNCDCNQHLQILLLKSLKYHCTLMTIRSYHSPLYTEEFLGRYCDTNRICVAIQL